jgi:hypothetical protein
LREGRYRRGLCCVLTKIHLIASDRSLATASCTYQGLTGKQQETTLVGLISKKKNYYKGYWKLTGFL